jgi:RHS repeat-associated protein
MTLVDRVNRERSLAAISRTRRSGRIAANASVLTTTYAYDANGNLIQAGGWSYMWDYLNRMLASGFNNSTTSYAYDEFGSRVLQTSTTSSTYYPNKYYSFTSTKIGANTYATSTSYIWNGDTLLATIDQKLYNGAATGSPITRYIQPDHLGSTNAVTDQNGALVQLLDYYPYGATRDSTSTYPTNEKRQYIDQFSDAQTGLNYLNARYYNSAQGQFLSEDPVFWGNQSLSDPQSFNTYSYANNNPIARSDKTGTVGVLVAVPVIVGLAAGVVAVGSLDYPIIQYNFQHDYPLTFGLPSAKEQAATGLTAAWTAGATSFSALAGQPEIAVGVSAAGSGASSLLVDRAAQRPYDTDKALSNTGMGVLGALMPDDPYVDAFKSRSGSLALKSGKVYGYETASNVAASYAGTKITPQTSKYSNPQTTYISAPRGEYRPVAGSSGSPSAILSSMRQTLQNIASILSKL